MKTFIKTLTNGYQFVEIKIVVGDTATVTIGHGGCTATVRDPQHLAEKAAEIEKEIETQLAQKLERINKMTGAAIALGYTEIEE